MSDFDLLVRGREQDIAIADGKFAAIDSNLRGNSLEEIDATPMSILREGMERAADLDLLVAVHAESQEITQRLAEPKLAGAKTSVRDYLDSRPIQAELDAIGAAVDLAAETKCRLHIVHVSCGR